MRRTQRIPQLYGPRGELLQPTAYTTFFEGGARYPNGDITPMSFWNGAQDTEKLLPTVDWKQLMNSGRFLFGNVPVLRGALLEQATYSFPLEPHYTGADLDWGTLAKRWLYDWKQSADVRGHPYDCHTAARIRLLARKTDGDIARLLTFDPGSEYPRLQFIRAHRIGDRESYTRPKNSSAKPGYVPSGPYAGQRMNNGIILDERGAAIAYRVLGDTEGDDQDVPASAMVFTYNPDYADQSRGISELMACVTSFADIKRLREYEMRSQQLQARESITEDNEEGEAQPGTGFFNGATTRSTTPAGVTIEQLDKGLTRYYRSNTGSGLKLVRPDRPGPGCQEFENRILAGAFYGIEWDPNFALMLKEPGGALARTILQKVNRAIGNNQRIEARAELAEDTWALAKAIQLKILPAPKDGDFTSWDYSGPARLTADSGNDENAKREKYKIGALTLRKWAAEEGEWWEETRNQKEIEVRDKLTRAKGLQSDFPELTLQEAAEMLEQTTPNGMPPQPPTPEPGAKPAK